ncbi:small acid-soluble spore protein P (minor) [Paenibacillaceae bacterium GAS479]|nr:small acid-soluble spore protein P (minor) [Paenibacillaceae bacterium GAS479]
MSKPDSIPVSNPDEDRKASRSKDHGQPQAPMSGSKKVKNRNHVDHHNPQGG